MRLRGNLRWYKQDDNLGSRDQSTASGYFDWDHTETLSTHWVFDYQRTNQDVGGLGGFDIETWRGQFTFRHQLFESLRSTATFWSQYQDASFGSERRWRADVREDYRKLLGTWGRLELGVFPHWEMSERRPSEALTVENHLIDQFTPSLLRQTLIEQATIVVLTDPPSGNRVRLTEFVDYLLDEPAPGVLEIRRVATSTLVADGDAIEVVYEYDPGGDADLLSVGLDARAAITFLEALSLYWTRTEDEKHLLSGDPNLRLESRLRNRFGAAYSTGWMIARLEFEEDDSDTSPYDALSESISLFTSSRRRWRARFSASHRKQDYSETDEQVSRLLATGGLGAQVGRRGWLEIEGELEQERWDGRDAEDNDVDGLGLRAEFTWQFSSIRVTLGGLLSRVERRGQDETEDEVYLRVRREF
jgi:hypothetical protein